ncbi:2,3-bisphosphoglycerate-dependent phosphoglycerate mutase [Candidatus Westeberhardia cardiocondylae]|uniref:2,3-bisphosphoglycerate-dependent phosphoglycerate mutase n=1 Tax=Candidatus Westeberhardia cardiocondylae TaxID=1594731 RepID=A0A0H5BX60_9ENTR|nr:2,3-diphosphoglycerate-dependent phosphoglycerate mutase [Candidatus Westeberhardia cardiocondylae]CEN32199.1 2,3-bisphosphoglycerate-dependent phosphoglycerate mutase [Candidatus Westeberhardia cardiocondylae]
MNITKLVLIRHGESQWNYENKFTGWTDIDLSETGKIEAKNAGILLKKRGYFFDFAYTSLLKRAIHTLWIILDELDQAWIPVEKSWKLNERHYGSLQGLNKDKIIMKYGEKQVKQWRRSFSVSPPKIDNKDDRFPGNDIRYSKLNVKKLPKGESLRSTVNRVIPYWKKNIVLKIQENKRVIISAHGNSIRAIIKFLNNLNEKEILNLEIPTGIPYIYEFENNLNIIRHYFLY